MIKKFLFSIALFTIIVVLAGCGGSGGPTTGIPQVKNPGIPSIVQLSPYPIVAQTIASITFSARILDRNRIPVKNEPVTFTNLSPIGTINPQLVAIAGGVGIAAGGPVVVNTDGLGYATITLKSTTSGFATVQAEVNTGLGQVRDKKTVYFTTGSLTLLPSMTLDVDSNLNGTYNEADDFIILDDGNVVRIRATVYDMFGLVESGSEVTFETDVPYRVGQDPEAQCSDESDTCEIYFLGGNIRTTDGYGQARVDITVYPTSLRDYQTLFNVTAEADNGAFNLRTLFLEPVLVDTVAVSANMPIVASGGTSTITAFVTTSAGMSVPDGTSVSFTATAGGIEPFAQTTDGIATVKFTAPTLADGAPDLGVTITAIVAGVSGITTVTVTAPPVSTALAITPPSGDVTELTTAQTLDFQVSGGLPPYNIASSSPAIACNDIDPAGGDGSCATGLDTGDWTVNTDGGIFTVTIPAGDIVTADSTVTLSVTDSAGSPMVQATITITEAIP